MPSLLVQKLHPHGDIIFQLYKPIFLAICFVAVIQPSRYSVFHNRNTPIQLGLLWQSHLCQCFNTETSTQNNRSYTTRTLSISYNRNSYIRLVVIL